MPAIYLAENLQVSLVEFAEKLAEILTDERHVFIDQPASRELVGLGRERGTFVIPTLSLFAGYAGSWFRSSARVST